MTKFISFAFAFVILALPQTSYALSCAAPSLERALTDADAIFEGHVVKIEVNPGIGEKDNQMAHYSRWTIIADKAMKGMKAGDTVTVISEQWGPFIEGTKDWPEKEGEENKGLFVLYNANEEFMDQHDLEGTIYFSGMCGGPMWEATPENLKITEKLLAAPSK